MEKKYTKPKAISAAAVGGQSIKFDDHKGVISGRVEVHFETSDGDAYGQPEITPFDELTAAQQTLLQNFFDSLRTKVSADTKLLERNPQSSAS